jgi:hypothetical protein
MRELAGAGKRVEMWLALALLAASLGHLGREHEAQRALADYHAYTDRPVADMALFFEKQEHQDLLHRGIGLANGVREQRRPPL